MNVKIEKDKLNLGYKRLGKPSFVADKTKVKLVRETPKYVVFELADGINPEDNLVFWIDGTLYQTNPSSGKANKQYMPEIKLISRDIVRPENLKAFSI